MDVNADWPVWLDDDRLIFNRWGDNTGQDLYIAPADGSGGLEPWTSPNEEQQHVQQVTPDGRALLIQQRPVPNSPDSDLLVAPIDRPDEAVPVFDEPTLEMQGAVHPSGRWMAYASNRSGQFEIYITQFPRGTRYIPVSRPGRGVSPVWSPTGNELFFRRGGGGEDQILAAPVISTEPDLRLGPPEVVYEGLFQWCCTSGAWGRTFDVSPDGQRFLVVRILEDDIDVGVPNVPRIETAQGWLHEVERRLGVR